MQRVAFGTIEARTAKIGRSKSCSLLELTVKEPRAKMEHRMAFFINGILVMCSRIGNGIAIIIKSDDRLKTAFVMR